MAVQDLLLDQELLAILEELHDDSEEDLVGADWHQDAIRVTNEGLLQAGPERGLPWHVGNQLTILMGRLGSKDWRPSPDISVHPTLGTAPLSSLDARLHGVPPLIIEVASEGTYKYDLSTKRQAYAHKGVQEYLVFDPTQDYLHTAVLAWHATARGFRRWLASRDGRWHSRVLGIAFEPQGVLLRVFDAQGVLMLHHSEATRQLREREQQLQEREWQLQERGQQLHEHRREAEEHRREAEEHRRRIAELEAENRRLRGLQT